MPNAEKLAKKGQYFTKLIDLVLNSKAALIIDVDHVASKQMQEIRIALRGRAIVLMGKNTMIRKAMSVGHEEHPEVGMDVIRENTNGNMGFIFAMNCTLEDIQDVMAAHRRPSAAKAGQVSTSNLSLPAGPTGMDPSQTAFFQALNIGTKIVKGQIELVSEFPILKNGQKVTASAAVLLGKLNFKPFEFGMESRAVFQDGAVFPAAVLKMSESVLIQKFLAGISNVAALSLEIGVPTEAALPHMFGNAFRNVAALVADLDFSFEEVEEVKKFLADPSAYASACPAAPAAGGAAAPAAAAKAAVVVEEEEEEDMDFDLFG